MTLTDVRHALRALLVRPGYTAAAIVSIGIAVSVISVAVRLVHAVIVRPLAIENPDDVVVLEALVERARWRGFRYPELVRIVEHAGEHLAAVAGNGERSLVIETSGAVEMGTVSFVTDSFFDVVGVRVRLGRGFATSDHGWGATPTVVVSHAFWQSRLAGDPAAIGETITVGRTNAVLVGVLPGRFRGLSVASPVDVYMPMRSVALVAPPGNYFGDVAASIGDSTYPAENWIGIVARRTAGRDLAAIEAALTVIMNRTRADDLVYDAIVPLAIADAALPAWRRAPTMRMIAIFGIVSGVVFFAGCASVAGMMLVRGELRWQEMEVRACAGARRRDVCALVVLEAALLSALGSAVGLQVGAWLVGIAGRVVVVLPGGVPITHLHVEGTSWATIAVWAGASLVVTAVCGTGPALQVVRRKPSGGWRGAILAGQVAIVVALAVMGASSVRSVQAMRAVDLGFDGDGLFYVEVFFREGADYGRVGREAYRRLRDRVAAMPGVDGVALGHMPVVGGPVLMPIGVEATTRGPLAAVFSWGAGYGDTLGLTLVAGRSLDGARDADGGPAIAIVTEGVARRLWGHEDVIGRRLFLGPRMAFRVVGVVRDGRYNGLSEADRLTVFLPWEQNPGFALGTGVVVGRARRAADDVVAALRREGAAGGLEGAAINPVTLKRELDLRMRNQRMGVVSLGLVGGFALVLTVLGVYGSVAHVMACRRREMALRLALGARMRDVVTGTLAGTLGAVAVGLGLGAAVAAVWGELAGAYLRGVSPHDWVSYVAVIGGVAAVALVAGTVAVARAGRASMSGLMSDLR